MRLGGWGTRVGGGQTVAGSVAHLEATGSRRGCLRRTGAEVKAWQKARQNQSYKQHLFLTDECNEQFR